MKKIKINSFCYIKFLHGMYMLIDCETLRVLATAFDLEQLTSELIRHYNNYLSESDEVELVELIKVIKDLKTEIRKLEVFTGGSYEQRKGFRKNA